MQAHGALVGVLFCNRLLKCHCCMGCSLLSWQACRARPENVCMRYTSTVDSGVYVKQNELYTCVSGYMPAAAVSPTEGWFADELLINGGWLTTMPGIAEGVVAAAAAADQQDAIQLTSRALWVGRAVRKDNNSMYSTAVASCNAPRQTHC